MSVDELHRRQDQAAQGLRRDGAASGRSGGGALIFDEYGKLKYQIANRLENVGRQTRRLAYLWETGFFEQPVDDKSAFANMHLMRSTT